ncbi:MAG: DUF4190 domain-containing protein [Bacteroidia bacterium]
MKKFLLHHAFTLLCVIILSSCSTSREAVYSNAEHSGFEAGTSLPGVAPLAIAEKTEDPGKVKKEKKDAPVHPSLEPSTSVASSEKASTGNFLGYRKMMEEQVLQILMGHHQLTREDIIPAQEEPDPEPRLDAISLIAFILGLLALLLLVLSPGLSILLSLVAIVLGIIGIVRTSDEDRKGTGFAIAGLIMGIIVILLVIALVILIFLSFF